MVVVVSSRLTGTPNSCSLQLVVWFIGWFEWFVEVNLVPTISVYLCAYLYVQHRLHVYVAGVPLSINNFHQTIYDGHWLCSQLPLLQYFAWLTSSGSTVPRDIFCVGWQFIKLGLQLMLQMFLNGFWVQLGHRTFFSSMAFTLGRTFLVERNLRLVWLAFPTTHHSDFDLSD